MPADEYQVQIASYPGAAGVESASYFCNHGISPGVATVVVSVDPKVSGVAGFGTLVLSDGNRSLVLRDCKLERIQFNQDAGGQTWTLYLSDRRWRWAHGTIGGNYNQIDWHGKLVPWSVRSPEELAKLALERMGETGYSIDLPPGVAGADFADRTDWFEAGAWPPPSGTNPPFVADATVPAQFLSQIAETFGRRVVFDPVTDRVLIAKPGDGGSLPAVFVESQGSNIEAPKTPKGYGIVGAEMLFQMRWRLRAVGEEWEADRFVPIDQLSYKPDKKTARNRPWDYSAPGSHGDVKPTEHLNYDQARQRAVQHVFRTYRLDDVSADPPPQAEPQKLVVPGYGEVKDRWRVIPQPFKVERCRPVPRDENQVTRATSLAPVYDYYSGFSRALTAIVLGSVCKLVPGNWWLNDGRHANTPDGERVDVAFSIDPVLKLVTFDRPVYLMYPWKRLTGDPAGRDHQIVYRPAPLVLECAVQVVDDVTLEPVRYRRWQTFNPDGSLGEIKDNAADPRDYPKDPDYFWYFHPDVEYNQVAKYEFVPRAVLYGADDIAVDEWDEWYGGLYKVTEVVLEDESDAVARADYYLAGHSLEYLIKGGVQGTYAALMPVPMDGAVMETHYELGHGATTTASRNCEVSPYFPPYPARRRQENIPVDPKLALQNLTDRQALSARIAAAAKANRGKV
jgi:hypothetical protein